MLFRAANPSSNVSPPFLEPVEEAYSVALSSAYVLLVLPGSVAFLCSLTIEEKTIEEVDAHSHKLHLNTRQTRLLISTISRYFLAGCMNLR